jgi:hypothetical protein
MRTSKGIEEASQTPPVSNWISGFVTVYPRYGAPRKLSFPCTVETQLLLQRLEQEQTKLNGNRSDS